MNHTTYIKLISVLILSILILLIYSCSKDLLDDSKYYTLDKEIYFKLTTGTDTYTTYGYSYNKNGTTFNGPEINITRDADSSTPAQTDLSLFAGEAIYDIYDNSIVFSMGNCYADWWVGKPGFDLEGKYNLLLGTETTNVFRIFSPNKEYYLDKNGLAFNILKQDILHNKQTVEGNFTGILHLASNPSLTLPANGSFKVYIK
jgi:uncharacterized protein YxeA